MELVHDVCPCGCTTLTIPAGVSLDQCYIRFPWRHGMESIRVNIQFEKTPPMHGWQPLNQ